MKALLLSLFLVTAAAAQPGFVKTSGLNFVRDGQKYTYVGTNFWYGMNLGAHDRARLLRELDHLKSIGIKNLRILAASEGPDTEPFRIVPSLQTAPGVLNEDLLLGLDFLLSEMQKRDLTAVIMLGNYWHWSGGFAQYVNWAGEGPIPYPKFDGEARGGWKHKWASFWHWLKYFNYVTKFYSMPEAMKLYEDFITKIITRTNSVTGIRYVDDPTIMAWQLANEPAGFRNAKKYHKWIGRTAKLIKSLDSNHLVTTGAVGDGFPFSGIKHVKNHSYPEIDYATVHIWVQNRGWYNPHKPEKTYPKALKKMHEILEQHRKHALTLNKPLVFEEFGISRDKNLFAPETPVTIRDHYYQQAFDHVVESQNTNMPIAGINFWAWGGEGVPRHTKWQVGDPFIGDPPHEAQGWYSVYSSDSSTIRIISETARRLDDSQKKQAPQ